jgi:lipopolysaccharide/colanic/teichoic acid biosynthesis glycosyltransferase
MIESTLDDEADDQQPTWPLKRTRGKRALDLLVAGLLLILLAAPMLIIAIVIRLDSPGPALYRQRRMGRGGVPFAIWKFRTMRNASPDANHRQQALDWFHNARAPHGFKNEHDPRITRFGKYLRRTSLDELPQLINVIRGEMSLSGPRPMMAYERALYEPWYFEREVVRPGITGLWQVSGRDRLSAPEMMALDVRYVREWSLWLDLKILGLTIPEVLGDVRDNRDVVGTKAHSSRPRRDRTVG